MTRWIAVAWEWLIFAACAAGTVAACRIGPEWSASIGFVAGLAFTTAVRGTRTALFLRRRERAFDRVAPGWRDEG